MKKVSTAATKQSRNISQQRLTIGLDLLSIAYYSYNGNSSACRQKAMTSAGRFRIRRRALRA
jgi:hypothetical protein